MWDKKLRGIPQEIAKYCEVFSHMHNDMAIRHNKYYTWLTIIQVILQAYTAVIMVFLGQNQGTSGTLSISGIVAAIGSAICSGIETRFNLRVSTHKNKQYGSAYSKLQRNIQVKLVQQKSDIGQFISWASTQYDVLSSESPNIDADIMAAYGKKHPKLNIYYPGFIRDEEGDRIESIEEKPRDPLPAPVVAEKRETVVEVPEIDEEKTPEKTETLKRFNTELPANGSARRHSDHARRATWMPDNKTSPVRSATPPPQRHATPQEFHGRETSQEDVELGMLMGQFNNRFGVFEDPRPL